MVELADVPSTIAASGGEALTRERLRMAAICMVGLAMGASILPFCAVGAALGPMMLEFGWGANRVSLAYAVLMWAGALSIWPVGVLIDRFGARPVVTLGATAIAAVSLTLPLVRHFWQFCALAGLLGACGSSGLGYTRIVAALFGPRRGLAMGVFAAEGSILSLVMPAAMGRLVFEGGWRGAFMMIGVAILALAPLLYLGLAGGRAATSWSARWSLPASPSAEGRSAREVLRDRAFWTIVAAGLATAAIGGGALANIAAALGAKGFGPSAVLHAAPLTMVATLAGAICSGLVLDRTRSPKVAAAVYLATAVTYVTWALVTPRLGGEPVLAAGLAIGAFAYAAQIPLVGYVFSRYFGLKAFATVCGLQAFIQAVFVGLGAPVIGRSVGQSGDYNLVFAAGIVAQVLAALLYLSLPAYRYAAVGDDAGEGAGHKHVPIARVRSQ
jgi:hypothetical protein